MPKTKKSTKTVSQIQTPARKSGRVASPKTAQLIQPIFPITPLTGLVVFLLAVVSGLLILSYQKKERLNYQLSIEQQQTARTMSKANCLADDCLAVSEVTYPVAQLPAAAQSALAAALDDEYKALATYEAVIAKFGPTRPFSMIKGAEEQHIASLKAVFDKYGLDIPTNPWTKKVTAPVSLQAACQTGVAAEIANAALYRDKLLPQVTEYPDITAVFTNLMNASQQKHLPAFERCN